MASGHLLRGYAGLLQILLSQPGDPARAAAAHARRRSYCAAELRNRNEHDALARIFGFEFARHYLEEFLFKTEPQAGTRLSGKHFLAIENPKAKNSTNRIRNRTNRR
jgi:hypothetical protein